MRAERMLPAQRRAFVKVSAQDARRACVEGSFRGSREAEPRRMAPTREQRQTREKEKSGAERRARQPQDERLGRIDKSSIRNDRAARVAQRDSGLSVPDNAMPCHSCRRRRVSPISGGESKVAERPQQQQREGRDNYCKRRAVRAIRGLTNFRHSIE